MYHIDIFPHYVWCMWYITHTHKKKVSEHSLQHLFHILPGFDRKKKSNNKFCLDQFDKLSTTVRTDDQV